MKSCRNPKYNERYEDVVFDLETALRVSKRMDPDLLLINSGEVAPFDWYNARMSINFKVNKTANNNNNNNNNNNTNIYTG